jgi:hypothetical protein
VIICLDTNCGLFLTNDLKLASCSGVAVEVLS